VTSGDTESPGPRLVFLATAEMLVRTSMFNSTHLMPGFDLATREHPFIDVNVKKIQHVLTWGEDVPKRNAFGLPAKVSVQVRGRQRCLRHPRSGRRSR
jgi:hypothetical protein